MKNLSIVLLSFFLGGCLYHNNDVKAVMNVTLYDKSVPVIKTYISGKWKLNYRIGGFTGNERTDYTNTYYEFQFQSTDTFIRTDSGKVTINSPITWLKYQFANSSINGIEYAFPNGVELGFYAQGIQNGNLILVEPCSDCYTYYLTRSN